MPMPDPRQFPPVLTLDSLCVACDEITRNWSAGSPAGLAARLQETAVTAAAALLRGCHLPRRRRVRQLEESTGLLRELGYLVELAQRLQYFSLPIALDLLERVTLAQVQIAVYLRSQGDWEARG
jgi:hypothetical protein